MTLRSVHVAPRPDVSERKPGIATRRVQPNDLDTGAAMLLSGEAVRLVLAGLTATDCTRPSRPAGAQ